MMLMGCSKALLSTITSIGSTWTLSRWSAPARTLLSWIRCDLQVTWAVTLLFNVGGDAELVVIGQFSPDMTYVIGAGELSPVLLVLPTLLRLSWWLLLLLLGKWLGWFGIGRPG